MNAGRKSLTAAEKQAIDALLDGTADGERRAFKEQLRVLRAKRKAERERGHGR